MQVAVFMNLGRKFAFGFATLMMLTGAAGVVSVVSVRGATAVRAQLVGDYSMSLAAIERLRYRAEQVVATSRGYLLTGDPRLFERFEVAEATLLTELGELAVLLPPNLAGTREPLERAADEYLESVRAAIDRRGKAHDPSELTAIVDEELMPLRTLFEARLNDLVRLAHAQFNEVSQSADDGTHSAAVVVSWLAVSACMLAGFFGLLALHQARWLGEREQISSERLARAAATREELLVVAHDIKNPLSAVLLASELALHSLADGVAGKARSNEAIVHVLSIKRAANRIRRLLDDLLDSARLEAKKCVELRREVCRIDEIVRESKQTFEASARARGVKLVSRACAGVIHADRDRLLRVIANLLSNAISVSNVGDEVILEGVLQAGSARFVVSDNGPGIERDLVPKIFDRHWQGQGRDTGNGLGLHIAKTLVELHGGALTVQSTPGAGSTFTVTLPRSDESQHGVHVFVTGRGDA